MIGPIVTVTVDRPLGSYHPEHPDIYYPINYGYIEGTMAADGEEEDAYVLGITEPVSEFTGRIIAIINRENDIEHKWVVAPDGMTFTQEEIAELTHSKNSILSRQYQKEVILFLYLRHLLPNLPYHFFFRLARIDYFYCHLACFIFVRPFRNNFRNLVHCIRR